MPEFRRISATFTQEEFARLKEAKEETGLNWHNFILQMFDAFAERGSDFPPIPSEADGGLVEKLSKLRSLARKN